MRTSIISTTLATFALCLSMAAAIPPPRLPLPSPLHEEGALLSDYERKTLLIELNNLTREITRARQEAARDPSLEPARNALQAAIELDNSRQIADARRALADAVETILLRQPGMPKKVSRLLDVGRLLEYDSQRKKDLRRRTGTRCKQHRQK